MFKEATTAPVVGEIFKLESELETDETDDPPPAQAAKVGVPPSVSCRHKVPAPPAKL